MCTRAFDISIRVLISREDDQYVAHGLEMDLLGYGNTEEAALKDLFEAIRCQITFAVQQGNDDLLTITAPAEYIKRWEEAQQYQLRVGLTNDRSGLIKTKATFIQNPKQTINAASVPQGKRHKGRVAKSYHPAVQSSPENLRIMI